MKQKQEAVLTIDVSRETSDRLRIYAEIVERWNGTINLVSRKDIGLLWERHINDALQMLSLMPTGIDRAIDLGSGAGFPGLVLAIASGAHFELIEADHRKAAFLREAARVTDAPVTVHAVRLEVAKLAPAGLVTARALAPLSVLIGLAEPFLQPGGTLLAPKGAQVDAELTEAEQQWHMRVQRAPSRTNAAATILQITEVSRVGQ